MSSPNCKSNAALSSHQVFHEFREDYNIQKVFPVIIAKIYDNNGHYL